MNAPFSKIIYKSKYIILFFILFFSCLYLHDFWLLEGHLLIKVISSSIFSLVATYVVYTIFSNQSSVEIWKFRGIIAGAVFVVYLPLLVDGVYYYDDYWGFTGEHSMDGISMGMGLMRVLGGILLEFFGFVLPENSYLIKWFSVTLAIVLAIIIFEWINFINKGSDLAVSFFIALVLVVFSPMTDHIAYSSTLPVLPSLLCASLSFIAYMNAVSRAQMGRVIHISTSIIFLIASFAFYQVSVAMVFVLIALWLYFSDEDNYQKIKLLIGYVFIFITGGLSYFVSGKIFANYYGIDVWNRGSLISGANELLGKVIWFVKVVLPASVDRLFASFSGRLVFPEKNYSYFLTYEDSQIRLGVYLLFIVVYAAFFILYSIRKKNIWMSIVLFMLIPGSYFVFIVLKENSYLTYYALPLISLLLLFFVFSLKEFLLIINRYKSNFFHKILFIILVVASIQNMIYIRQSWIGAAMSPYSFIKNSILTNLGNRKKIHIYGVPNPGQGNIYSVFAAQVALKEIGLSPDDYQITSSDDPDKVSIIQDDIMGKTKNILSENEISYLKSFYQYDETYSRYILKGFNLPSEELTQLKSIYKKAGLISDESNALIIDLRWNVSNWITNTFSKKISIDISNTLGVVQGNFESFDIIDNASLVVKGWGVLDAMDANKSKIYIVLQGDFDHYIYEPERISRPDVTAAQTKYLNMSGYDLDNSGFSSRISLGSLPDGSYKIGIFISNSDARGILISGKTLKLQQGRDAVVE